MTMATSPGRVALAPASTLPSPTSSPAASNILADTSDPTARQTEFSILYTSGSFNPTASATYSLASFPGVVPTVTSTSTPSAAAPTNTSGATAPASTSLNTAQIAGIAVVSAVVLLAAIGSLLLVLRMRRKRRRFRDSASSFGNDRILPSTAPSSRPGDISISPASSSSEHRQGIGKALEAGHGDYPLGADRMSGWSTPALWRPRTDGQGSPISISSQYASSRLLPDKPTFSIAASRSSSLQPGNPPQFAAGVGLRLIGPTPTQSVAWSQDGRSFDEQSQEATDGASAPYLSPAADPQAMMEAMQRRRQAARNQNPDSIGNLHHTGAELVPPVPPLPAMPQLAQFPSPPQSMADLPAPLSPQKPNKLASDRPHEATTAAGVSGPSGARSQTRSRPETYYDDHSERTSIDEEEMPRADHFTAFGSQNASRATADPDGPFELSARPESLTVLSPSRAKGLSPLQTSPPAAAPYASQGPAIVSHADPSYPSSFSSHAGSPVHSSKNSRAASPRHMAPSPPEVALPRATHQPRTSAKFQILCGPASAARRPDLSPNWE